MEKNSDEPVKLADDDHDEDSGEEFQGEDHDDVKKMRRCRKLMEESDLAIL